MTDPREPMQLCGHDSNRVVLEGALGDPQRGVNTFLFDVLFYKNHRLQEEKGPMTTHTSQKKQSE